VLSSQYCGSLDQLKNQCRDAGDCHHRPHNYDGTRAPASARQSLRIGSYCLFSIGKPPDDLSFHLVPPLQSDARAYASVADHERYVFVGDVRVTTFHTYS
jgi:hypothetical protein